MSYSNSQNERKRHEKWHALNLLLISNLMSSLFIHNWKTSAVLPDAKFITYRAFFFLSSPYSFANTSQQSFSIQRGNSDEKPKNLVSGGEAASSGFILKTKIEIASMAWRQWGPD